VTAAATAGLVSAKDITSGQSFQFNAKNQILLQAITVGQKVFANFTARQVSLDGKQVCCLIVSFAGTHPTAISKVGASGATLAAPTSTSAIAVAPIAAQPIESLLYKPERTLDRAEPFKSKGEGHERSYLYLEIASRTQTGAAPRGIFAGRVSACDLQRSWSHR
jgi:hypothetical protein